MSYLNNSDKIKIELALAGIKKDMEKMSLLMLKYQEKNMKAASRQASAK